MTENSDNINQLLDKLDVLSKRQDSFLKEIDELRNEIARLKGQPENIHIEQKTTLFAEKPAVVIENVIKEEAAITQVLPPQTPMVQAPIKYDTPKMPTQPKVKSNIEKFIGENLINKIGIAITVIGVGIGAKYSIEHQLISPLTRIILGYLVGLGLLGFGMKLKNKYENYSAVLVSGAIAIMFFITYAGYSFYGLFPQIFAFVLMVVFMAFTVLAAIKYNKQVIAHIGLVGAYAVPFLLSDGSGRVAVLFSYMAIINTGILLIAIRKYWKPLYYASFSLTWLIYLSWFVIEYRANEHFALSLTFLGIFFTIFYIVFLAYKLVQKEKFDIGNVVLLLVNSFVFYGLGYAIISTHAKGDQFLGLFTLCNAVIHFAVSVIIYRQKLADRNLFFLVVGLVLVFITIAVPVQLDGNWVTLLWVFEAALLFWIGRTKNVAVYEILSYPLMLLGFFSLAHDWEAMSSYQPGYPGTRITLLVNIYFLTGLLFVAAFAFIHYLNNNRKYISPVSARWGIASIMQFAIPGILLIVLYYSLRLEISTYWNQLYIDSAIDIKRGTEEFADTYRNEDLKKFETIWVIIYSLLFFSFLSFVNIRKIRNRTLGLINLVLNTFVIVVFLTQGLYILSKLRDSYLNQTFAEYYYSGSFNIGIRYVTFAAAGLILLSVYKYIQQDFMQPLTKFTKVAFDSLLHISLLWVASSELITWLNLVTLPLSNRLGLSILWGVYALVLISLGISKKKKHLRIGAIGLFAVTLLKLFFYDISHLNTIAKTIVFVSLGVLLLIISFLYNKYKHLITEENEH